jgi:hypothetical protein
MNMPSDNHNLPSDLTPGGQQEQTQIAEPAAAPEQAAQESDYGVLFHIQLPVGILALLDDPTKLTPIAIHDLGRAIYKKCCNAAKALGILGRRYWHYEIDDEEWPVPDFIDLYPSQIFRTIEEAEAALKRYGVPADTVEVFVPR